MLFGPVQKKMYEVWSVLVWSGLAWSGLAWSGLVWSGLAWPGLVWSGLVWPGLVWPGLVWSGLVWSGLVWPGLAWPGLVWPGLVWSVPGRCVICQFYKDCLLSVCFQIIDSHIASVGSYSFNIIWQLSSNALRLAASGYLQVSSDICCINCCDMSSFALLRRLSYFC